MQVSRNTTLVLCLNVAIKLALVGLLAFGAFSGLQQFEGKAFFWRLLTYPVASLIVPVVWTARYRSTRYPYAADILLTLPFLVDTAGNALDLYDSVVWWDDANHLVNWGLLSGAVAALCCRNRVSPWQALACVVGFGAVTAILWEIAEYYAFIRNSPELDTAYTDTLGDMALGLTGSAITGVFAAIGCRNSGGIRNKDLTSIREAIDVQI